MSDKTVEIVADVNNISETTTDGVSTGLLSSIFKKLNDNKIYILLCVSVIVLGISLYYFFIKNKKEISSLVDTNTNKNNDEKKEILNNQEYYVLDSNGNPVKISGVFNQQPIQQNTRTQLIHPSSTQPTQPTQPTMTQQEIMILQKQLLEKEKLEAQHLEQQLREKHNDELLSEDINNEISRIQENEDNNIAQHNLTNSELEEINRKLEMMNASN